MVRNASREISQKMNYSTKATSCYGLLLTEKLVSLVKYQSSSQHIGTSTARTDVSEQTLQLKIKPLNDITNHFPIMQPPLP